MSPFRTPINGPGQQLDPSVIANEVDQRYSEKHHKIVANLKIITPIFGGGFDAGSTPENLEIRSSTVKGHLRFWWRATVLATKGDVAELLKRERELFGGASGEDEGQPSKVSVQTEVLSEGEYVRSGVHPQNSNGGPPKAFARFEEGPAYALWTLQQPKEEREKADNLGNELATKFVRKDARFKLIISFPNETGLSEQISQALKAWILFGGYGSRTRRGLGSLELASAEPAGIFDALSVEDYDQLSEAFTKPDNSATNPWPRLSGSHLYIGKPHDTAKDAWKKAIDLFQEFRQGEGVGRNSASDPSNRFKLGRSRWPEPDSLREIRQGFSPVNWGRHTPNHPARIYFPRADFGLPIQFRFIGRPDEQANAKLTFAGTDRYASRLIIKVMSIKIGGKQTYLPIVLNLNVSHVWNLSGSVKLEFDDRHDYTLKRREMENTDSAEKVKLINERKALTASEAFCHYFKSKTDGEKVSL